MAFPHIDRVGTNPDGPITEADLDRLIAAHRAPLPAGCNQQGRYMTRPDEACTELGADQPDHSPVASAVFWSAYLALALVAAIAALAAHTMTTDNNTPIGVVYGMPAEEYHAVPALSATGLRALARSAWHFKHRVSVMPTKPMLRGTLAHCAVLEPHAMADRYVVVPADAPRRPTRMQWEAKKPSADSLAAMQWWTDFNASAEGRQIVSADDYAITQMQLEALAAEPTCAGILREGRGEVSVFWIDQRTGVYCKARPDWMTPAVGGRVTLLDLKSTADESPSGFGRAAARMKYHIQRSHYVDGVRQATGWQVDEFVFAAVTSAAPVLAVPYFLTDAIKEQADDERADLIDLYARCIKTGAWPAYGDGLQMLDFPAYAKRDSEVEVAFAD